MSEKNRRRKRIRTRSGTRRILRIVLRTTGVLLLLIALLFITALLTVDLWIVPLVCRCTGLEVEGRPGVRVSLFKRTISLTDLKVNCPAGRVEMKSCALKLDDWTLRGWSLAELRVSQVRAEGVRAELDFAKYAELAGAMNDPITGERMRTLSHTVWNRASKTVVRVADLNLSDAEVRWRSGASQSVISVPSLTAEFEDGRLTRPRLTCGVDCAMTDPQRSLRFGLRIRAATTTGSNSVIVSAAGNGPLKIDLPDAHLEFPPSETLDMLVQYEPDSDLIRFGGEWGKSDRWECLPLELSMDNALFEMFGTLALDGEKLLLRFGTSAQGSDLVCRGNDIPGDVKFDAKCNVDFDLATGAVRLDSLSGHLTGPNGGRVDLETNGVFEFVRNEDATYTLSPQAARLTLATGKPVDLTPYDPVLPFDAEGRELTAEYFIDLDPEQVRLHGGAGAAIRDRATGACIFDSDAVFEADGVNRISSFHVSRCGMAFYDGEDRICQASFTGEYDIRTASLKGEAKYFPYRMIDAFGSQGFAELCSFLDDANLRDAEHTATATLDLDLVNMAATLHKESHLSHLALTGSNGKNLELDAVGDAEFRLAPDGGGWQLDCGLELNAGPDFHSVMHASGVSGEPITGGVEVERLSDVLVHQLERKFCPAGTEPPFLRFRKGFGSADFRYDAETARISVTGLNATVDNGDGRMEIASDSELVWVDGVFHGAPVDLSLRTVSLPVSFLEPLPVCAESVRLAGGVMSSELEISVGADGKVVGGVGKFVGTDLTFLLNGIPYAMARVGANGSFVYNHEMKFLILPEMNVDVQKKRERPALFAAGSGTVDFADECRTQMEFPEVRIGPDVLFLIGNGVERSFYFEDLDAVGNFSIDAKRVFSEVGCVGTLNVNRARLQSDDPEAYRFEELSGRIDCDFLWADNDLFGNGMIQMSDEEGEEHFSGQYVHSRGSDAPPKFISSSVDLPFSMAYFQYNRNTDPEIDTSEIIMFNKTFDLDLHGVYTRSHALIFSMKGPLILRDGEDPVILLPHMEFSGDMFGTASMEIHVTEDIVCPFEFDADLNDIPLDKCFTAFLATDDSPEIPHDLHGFVKRIRTVAKGVGFTAEDLTRNLEADCKVELEQVSLRSSLRDSSLFLNILLTPLLSVPRLIDCVPGDMIRRVLRLATAGAIMDMISGEAPIEFKRGTMDLSVRQGVVELKDLSLEGDPLEEYVVRGTVDLAEDGKAELETNTRFALFHWPIYLEGNVFDPQVAYGKSISHFFTDNTKRLLFLFPNMILSTFSQEDADKIDSMELEKTKSKGREKGSADGN